MCSRGRAHCTCSAPPLTPRYDHQRSPPLTLADGRRLVTLRDAADLIHKQFGRIIKRALEDVLDQAIYVLLQAGDNGTRQSVAAAITPTRWQTRQGSNDLFSRALQGDRF